MSENADASDQGSIEAVPKRIIKAPRNASEFDLPFLANDINANNSYPRQFADVRRTVKKGNR